MMEATLLLATIAQHVSFDLATEQPIELEPLITLKPKGGMPLILHWRKEMYGANRGERVTIAGA